MSRNWFSKARSIQSAASKRRLATCRPKLELLEKREVPTNLPAGFSETTIATGMPNPTAMEFAPDGRLFVAQQTGELRVIKNGSLLPDPFLKVTTNFSGERGLLGIAFDPSFTNNGFVYIFYTVPSAPIHNRVSRFTADPGNPDKALPGSELPILELNNLSGATNHNGGAIHFGLDGKLYVAAGENANPPQAQAVRNTHGKLLRINSDGTIPPDNPFANSQRARKEIWARGFRNPYTFAVQPGTGRIYVNDVGSSGGGRREEVNNLTKKGNFGWPINEGYTNDPNYVSPVFAYSSSFGGSNCAVVGGVFFNPPSNPYPPEYFGKYFFADLCGNWIYRLDPDAGVPADTVTNFATSITSGNPVDMKVSSTDNHLYYVVIGGGGVVRRINYSPPAPPGFGPAMVALGTSATNDHAREIVVTPGVTLSRPAQSSTPNVEVIDAAFSAPTSSTSSSTFVLNRPTLDSNDGLVDPIVDVLA